MRTIAVTEMSVIVNPSVIAEAVSADPALAYTAISKVPAGGVAMLPGAMDPG